MLQLSMVLLDSQGVWRYVRVGKYEIYHSVHNK